MIADMLSNKKHNLIVTELFIRGIKLQRYRSIHFSCFYRKFFFYFAVPKSIRLNSTHYFIMRILNKTEL